MGAPPCKRCIEAPIVRCGRCTTARCAIHAFPPGERCESCERDWKENAPTRQAAKLMFAPSVAVLTGGLLLGLLILRGLLG